MSEIGTQGIDADYDLASGHIIPKAHLFAQAKQLFVPIGHYLYVLSAATEHVP